MRSRYYVAAGECAACRYLGAWTQPHTCVGQPPFRPVADAPVDPRTGLAVGERVRFAGQVGTVDTIRPNALNTLARVLWDDDRPPSIVPAELLEREG